MAMYNKIYKGDFRCPKWMSPDLKRFLSRLLDVRPESRVTVDKILCVPWFKKDRCYEKAAAKAISFDQEDDDDVDCYGCLEDGGKLEEKAMTKLNAFDLISFSSGLDLFGLFEQSSAKRFVTMELGEKIMQNPVHVRTGFR